MRRQALITATLDAVADLGLAGATVREVAARASVTPGLIRRYFLSKDRLVEAAYKAFIDDMMSAIQAQVGDGTPSERLKRLALAFCTEPVAGSRNIAIWAAFIGVVPGESAVAAVHRDGYHAFRLLLEEIIRDLLEDAGHRPDATLVSRRAIAANALIDGIWLEVSLDRDAFEGIDIETLALEGLEAVIHLHADRSDKA